MSVVIFFRGSRLEEVERTELNDVIRRAIEETTGSALRSDQEARVEKKGYYTYSASFDWLAPESLTALTSEDDFAAAASEVGHVGVAVRAALRNFSSRIFGAGNPESRPEFFWELNVECLK
jgi:hypothetical protein